MKKYYLKKIFILIIFILGNITYSFAQDYRFENQRAEEDYSYLKDSIHLSGWDAIKLIPLSKQRSSYLSIGGSFRPRYEINTNQLWIPGNSLNYYSQRVAFHADLHLGNNFRVFGELQSGVVSEGDIFIQTDELAVHQGFVEYGSTNAKWSLRLGRQELQYGTGRLFDISIGPNVRKSFDLAKATWAEKNYKFDLFYGRSIEINFGAFDNVSDFISNVNLEKEIWGAYGEFKIFPNQENEINTELYYIGFNTLIATYNDVTGEEKRHTIGIRRFGKAWEGFTHNHELIYQFGKVGSNNISAFNFETNWNYQLRGTRWKPMIGLKLDWSSGDREAGDGKINSFNPLFVNPGLYNLAVVSTPVNLFSLHPSIKVFPSKKVMVQLEYAFFYRSSSADGIYAPPNRLIIMSGQLDDTHIGNTVGLLFVYQHNARINFSVRSSYYFGGDFVQSMGFADNIFQCSPTLEYKF